MPIPNLKKTMLSVYEADGQFARDSFLTSLFRTRPEYYTDGERISIDIVKSSRKAMPVVTTLGGEPVRVEASVFNGVEVEPPVYLGERPISVFSLLQREPGETEWTTARANWAAKVAERLRTGKNQITDMIMRSIEVQAAQVLQTGTLTLTDKLGNPAYTLNLGKNAAQIVTPATKWDQTGGDPEADVDALAQLVADTAGVTVATLVFGRKAWNAFMKNSKIASLIQKDSYNLGSFSNDVRGRGEVYKGFIVLGSFRLDLYVYNASYEDFQTGTVTRYLDERNVLVLPSEEDLDFRLLHAVYPMVRKEGRFSNLVPDEATIGRVRFYNKVYEDEVANTCTIQVAARPLCLPVSLDNWGVLKEVCA